MNGEGLKYADVILSVLLSFCFTCMFKHSFLASAMLDSVIIPLVKNKCGDLSDISNYRLIAIFCIVSKIFENVILLRIEEYLWTTDNIITLSYSFIFFYLLPASGIAYYECIRKSDFNMFRKRVKTKLFVQCYEC